MDRELVFAVLVAALCGCAVIAGGWWPTQSFRPDTHLTERQLWHKVWIPLAPAALVFALLYGWALDEPAAAEPVPRALMLMALPFAVIFARAIWRTTRSLAVSHRHLMVATVGFFRPRIVVAPQFSSAIDRNALAAALEHERAHVRHRDPLRMWLARLATELMWPAPAALIRLQAWKRALEMARDDEARAQGAAGPDLAAAILASLRLSQAALAPAATAAALADDIFIKERIARLLQPAAPLAASDDGVPVWLVILSIAVPLAIFIGLKFGEKLIGSLLTAA